MNEEFLNPVRKPFSNGVKLTNTVYKLLEFFPESDPLKNRAKDRALQILENLMEAAPRDGASLALLGRDIDVLLGYLWIGKSQGWLNSSNCLIIANEYEKIKKEIEPIIELTQKLPGIENQPVLQEVGQEPAFVKTTARQRKILEFLSQNEKAQVMDLRAILPDVTKRTIRRDLDELLEAGKIVRLGEFNQVFYKIK